VHQSADNGACRVSYKQARLTSHVNYSRALGFVLDRRNQVRQNSLELTHAKNLSSSQVFVQSVGGHIFFLIPSADDVDYGNG
jgi:hypothetical protein